MKAVFTSIVYLYLLNCSIGQHSVNKMPYPVNTDVYDEICPVLSFDEQELFFTREGSPDFDKTIIENGENLYETLSLEAYASRLRDIFKMITGDMDVNPEQSSFNQDVWYATYYNGEIYNLYHPKHPLNNALPNSICAHYGKDDSYVVINKFEETGGVEAGFSTVKQLNDLDFTFPQPIKIQDFDNVATEVNISMSIDKQYIILAMVGPQSNGDKDLYLSVKMTEGWYSTPEHLGDILNSSYSEATPFFSQDKKKLYFASNRPGGLGGMDIYVSDRLDYSFKKWSTPVLLGPPINSTFNDSHPYIQVDENSILFTSDREGSSDIFFGKMVRDDSLYQDIKVNIYVVKEGEREKTYATLYWGRAYSNEWEDLFRVRDGEYKYLFTENIPMKFKAKNRGLVSEEVIVDPQELQLSGINEIDLFIELKRGEDQIAYVIKPVQTAEEEEKEKVEIEAKKLKEGIIPLKVNSTIVLKNIFFTKGKPDVLPQSYPSLINLADAIRGRDEVVIQVEGHTDNVGDAEALMNLSLARANAIRDFLLKNGVASNQVKTFGYGATRPITKNRTEKERAKNRRVEIRILRQ